MYPLTFPFEPPLEDLKMTFKANNGVQVFIFDSDCRIDKEEKRRRDRSCNTTIRHYYEQLAIQAAVQDDTL